MSSIKYAMSLRACSSVKPVWVKVIKSSFKATEALSRGDHCWAIGTSYTIVIIRQWLTEEKFKLFLVLPWFGLKVSVQMTSLAQQQAHCRKLWPLQVLRARSNPTRLRNQPQARRKCLRRQILWRTISNLCRVRKIWLPPTVLHWLFRWNIGVAVVCVILSLAVCVLGGLTFFPFLW